MENNDFIKLKNECTSINFPKFGEGNFHGISSAEYAFRKGEKNALNYDEEKLIEMLRSGNYEEVHEALGAIGKRKFSKALPYLKDMALFDEDKSIQEEAIYTIKRIGGRNAHDILRFLRTTEHKEFIDEMLDE